MDWFIVEGLLDIEYVCLIGWFGFGVGWIVKLYCWVGCDIVFSFL